MLTVGRDVAAPRRSPWQELLGPKEGWMSSAACRGRPPDEFFPSDALGVLAAQRRCAICVVREECLEYALSHRISDGVWGGHSERARRRLLRERGEWNWPSPRPSDPIVVKALPGS